MVSVHFRGFKVSPNSQPEPLLSVGKTNNITFTSNMLPHIYTD
jgi:hypothetical protein